MQNDQALIRELYTKWANKQASAEETQRLFDLLSGTDIEQLLGPAMKDRWDEQGAAAGYDEKRQRQVVRQILEAHPPEEDKPSLVRGRLYHLNTRWVRYAAVLVLLAGAAIFLLKPANNTTAPMAPQSRQMAAKVLPGGNKARLTLADGSSILLDNATNGQLVSQAGTSILKSGNGEIIYRADQSTALQHPVQNTMTTPRGGNYRLTLPDGTLVWLNAASSITFPTAFNGTAREVRITGEVYFEVAKNAELPFRVNVDGQTQIEVLGTHFNINAYADEVTMNATLIEGSIRLTSSRESRTLEPGQQAQVKENGATTLRNDVDLQAVIAWKNDEFQFGEKADFKAIMRQIARWYDVDVVYNGNVSDHLGGSISRQADIGLVLKILETASGMHLELNGHTVTVTP